MGKDVYIVFCIIHDKVALDSVWWSKKKAYKRKAELDESSSGVGFISKKWVNPKIVLNPIEYNKKYNKAKVDEVLKDLPIF